ncbi:MAG: rhomboid family intramembrane serine protease [Bacteroidetes bacterium]|nr:rhomboid family intramembrane serine protease [Bacteroidota bacterium]
MNFNNQYRPSGFGYLPPVTKNIIIINVVMFLLTQALKYTQGIDLTTYLGLHYYQASNFRPHQFVTYLFMHGSLAHIFFNMFAVYIFGQVLEQVWGPKRYLIFYLLTGFGAALTQYVVIHFEIAHVITLVDKEILNPLLSSADRNSLYEQKDEFLNRQVIVGASGSLFGLLGAFGVLFPNRYLYLYFLFPVKTKWFVIFYGAMELIYGITADSGDNVAHFAHIGGLVIGIIIVLFWRKTSSNFY